MARKRIVEKNPAAVALGRKRWEKVSKRKKSAHGKKMAAARWDKRRKKAAA